MNPSPQPPVSDAPHPLQIAAWRAMGGAGRMRAALDLGQQIWAWKQQAVRNQHPDWTAERVEHEVARIYRRGNT